MNGWPIRLARLLKRYNHGLLLIVCLVLALAFRLWHLGSLPPGLAIPEALSGLAARGLVDHFSLAALGQLISSRDSLFTLLQAISVAILGHTALALRVVPALLGSALVVTTYYWARDWFGFRVAIVAALVLAVAPWGVILSRTSYSAITIPLLATLGLWLATRARWSGRVRWAIAAGAVIGLGGYAYPGGWPVMLLVGFLGLAGLITRKPRLALPPLATYVGVAALVLLPLAWRLSQSPRQLTQAPAGSVFERSVNRGNLLAAIGSATGKTLLMINYSGDSDYRHNVGGEPELNIFFGLMALLGLLSILTAVKKPRYLSLLALLVVGLIPGVVGAASAPDALRTLAALPPLAVLTGLGVSYMLGHWYRTFPINSAARTVGLSTIVLLLVLSIYHGYTEYFVAWADSPQTYAAQSEGANEMARFINSTPATGQRFVIPAEGAKPIIDYLADQPKSLHFVQPTDIAGLPLSIKPAQFVVDYSQRSGAVAALKLKFAGGQLRPHYSHYSGDELYDVYETGK